MTAHYQRTKKGILVFILGCLQQCGAAVCLQFSGSKAETFNQPGPEWRWTR